MREGDKPLVWLHGNIKTPPFSHAARVEAGVLLRRLQRGEVLKMPRSRPMPTLGPRCHELRIPDRGHAWRIFYRTDEDAVLIFAVEQKKSQKTPASLLATCRRRLAGYDQDEKE